MAKKTTPTKVESIRHKDKRANIPTEELRDFVADEEHAPKTMLYPRDPSLDPQLVWKGKDEQDSEDLAVPVVPIYIQEKIHPQAIIDALPRTEDPENSQTNLFADFNGGPAGFDQKVEFYHHEQNWTNRLVLGDSLMVMTSLAEKEGLKGKVQTIYLDPPYGIKFGSNWQVSTRKRDVKDGKAEDATRQPEQVRAFRDTWKLGIHSYLGYLRDRLMVARDLLTETGSVFVQINSENCHLVRSLLDEVYGSENFVADIIFRKKSIPLGAKFIETMHDHILFYAKDATQLKFRHLYEENDVSQVSSHGPYAMYPDGSTEKIPVTDFQSPSHPDGTRYYRLFTLIAPSYSANTAFSFEFQGRTYPPPSGGSWVVDKNKLQILSNLGRLQDEGKSLSYRLFYDDFPYKKRTSTWGDAPTSYQKTYVVQTVSEVIARCLLMTTDPGDLVLDPTCGSGTTAYVAEQWGRRWITCDTSRVALALARTRLMAAKYPYYLLADSFEGMKKEAELTGIATSPSPQPSPGYPRQVAWVGGEGDVRKGFVYKRVPHVTLKSIANNPDIDTIHAKWYEKLEPVLTQLSELRRKAEMGSIWFEIGHTMKDKNGNDIQQTLAANSEAQYNEYVKKGWKPTGPTKWEEWEVPREPEDKWNRKVKDLLKEWWSLRRERQKDIDAAIAKYADTETLFDQPYEDNKRVRVCGPFSVESLSPHRVLSTADENQDGTVTEQEAHKQQDFAVMILDNLKKAGVQNTRKSERLTFDRLDPYAGAWLHAAGEYTDADGKTRRVAVSIGPEHGTVGPQQVKEAAKEAVQGVGFDMLIVCGFAFDPHVAEEVKRYGKLTVLPAKMNPDLAMGDELLKKTGAGNLFMVFGEPDVDIKKQKNGRIIAEIKGLDVYDPTTGQIRNSSTDDIACWFIDTDYNGESFFVRHAYFTGADEPYDKLKRALRAEIDEAAWSSLYSTKSRAFDKPKTGKIAVKVINHYGDEVMKVFEISA